MSVRKWIAEKLYKEPEPTAHEYYSKIIALSNTKESGSILEERMQEVAALDKIETLYKVDPLFSGMVQEYIFGIASGVTFIGGNILDSKNLLKWWKDKGINFKIQDGILDIFLTGNLWLELIPDYGKGDLGLRILNPKTMDYIRDNLTNQVILMDDGSIMGYRQRSGMSIVDWTKDAVTNRGEAVITATNNEDLRTRIAHIKLWSFSDSYIGLTPATAVYKSCIIRMNVADMVGESSFRGGGLVAKVPRDASEQSKTNLENSLLNLTRKNVMVIEDRILVEKFPSPDIGNQAEVIYYFADEASAGMRVPLSLLMLGNRLTNVEKEQASAKFELSLRPLQERLAYQIREHILSKLWEVWDTKGPIPDIKFIQRTPNALLNRSRVISTLARRGIISGDPELEKSLREELELPTTFIQRELDMWTKDETKMPISGPTGPDIQKKPTETKPNTESKPEETKQPDKV